MPVSVALRDDQDSDAVGGGIRPVEDEALAGPVIAADLDTSRPVAGEAPVGHRQRAHAHDTQPAGSTMRSAFMEGWWIPQMMR